VEPAKGPDQNQNRDGNAEQPQEKITAHWMISDWISSLNECRFLERVPLLAVFGDARVFGLRPAWNRFSTATFKARG
jgi:hypothetical protein